MDLGIRGRKALLAGGSAGLGFASAMALAEEGVDLVLSARGAERLEAAARKIAEATGVTVTAVAADHSTEEGRARLHEACPAPDILVITITPPTPNDSFEEVEPEDWRASIETALIGPVELIRHYSAGMVERRWGRIVNIGTFAAKFPLDMRLMSGPARAALVNYTAVVSRQLARHGVLLNNVLPGMFGTEGLWGILDERGKMLGLDRDGMMKMFLETFDIPTGAVGEADDLAPQVALLCSERARFTVGQNIVIDGGQGRGMF